MTIIKILLILLTFNKLEALTFKVQPGSDIIGGRQYAKVLPGESLAEIGRKFDIGIYEMIESNPEVNAWRPQTDSKITIPSSFLLPPGERVGMVINLAEMRVYYYHTNRKLVTTHPIGIGRKDWETPLGYGKIISKKKDPSWRPPKSIRAWYNANGKYLPDIVPPGPRNPLGKYAMRLSIPGYLIHGTNRPGGVGVRSSSGCIRMYPEDIESFFHKISLGTKVRIVHVPFKVGRKNGKFYMESHQPLSDEYYKKSELTDVIAKIGNKTNYKHDPELVRRALSQSIGYPIAIN